MKIILGSKSPRRKELLKQMGISFEVYLSEVNEDIKDFKNPQDYVTKTAFKKGKAISQVFLMTWLFVPILLLLIAIIFWKT